MLSVPLSSGRTALISALTDLASRPHQRYFKTLWVKLGGMITPVTHVLHRGDDCLNVHSCSLASVPAYREQNKRCGFSLVCLMNADGDEQSLHTLSSVNTVFILDVLVSIITASSQIWELINPFHIWTVSVEMCLCLVTLHFCLSFVH